MTAPKTNPFAIDNSENADKVQKNLSVLIVPKMRGDEKVFNLYIVNPEDENPTENGIYFNYDTRFNVIQYYANYLRYLLGDKSIEKPKLFKMPEENAPESFDDTPYNGKHIIENQSHIHIKYYPLPESNGRNNWSVIPRSENFRFHEFLTFIRTEKYYEGLMYYHHLLYLLGERETKPDPKDYDLTLYRNYSTGNFYTPQKD